jgi:pseudouridine synthase
MSRSEAERCVLAGRASVNGRKALDPSQPCNPERDRILVDGRPLKARRKVYLAMNKPAGTITTARDPEGRPTAYDLLPSREENLQAVGRLDADTSGLLLFTNDTVFAARITGSSSGVETVYEARISGGLDPRHARAFESGILLDGQLTLPARVRILEKDETSTRVEITLTEGRNRQIRRMWEALGHEVLDLERKRIGPIFLGDLRPGEIRAVTEFERATLQVPER